MLAPGLLGALLPKPMKLLIACHQFLQLELTGTSGAINMVLRAVLTTVM
jgi:hypothetical protein